MRNIVSGKIIFVLLILLIFSCANDDDTVETISIIYVYESWGDEEIKIELSVPVTLPLNQEDAELIINECGCSCSGTLNLVDEEWVLGCCEEYPDCDIRIDVYTGDVECNYYG